MPRLLNNQTYATLNSETNEEMRDVQTGNLESLNITSKKMKEVRM